jgi:hypothetical protein
MPSALDSLPSLYAAACNGNDSALSFVIAFNKYAHGIDDIIDGDMTDKEEIIKVFVQGNIVFGHPFYLANITRLQPVYMLCASAYADSVKWGGSDKDGQRSMADVLRFVGNEMLFAVALICGGYELLRAISPAIRERSWLDHHDEKGEPK